MKETVFIYCLACPDTHKPMYVGQTTVGIKYRYSAHLAERGASSKHQWIAALAADGKKPLLILLEVTSIANGDYVEKMWIERFKANGFHLLNSADNGSNYRSLTEYKVHIDAEKFRQWNELKEWGDLTALAEKMGTTISQTKAIFHKRKCTPAQLEILTKFYEERKAVEKSLNDQN